MKKAVRINITGNLQSMFFKQFIKDAATKNNVKGFMRNKEGSIVEFFLQGETKDVDAMTEICKKGPKYANIRNVDIKDERLQDFTDFKIFNF